MTYTVVGTGGCANVSDTRIVTVTAPPVAGTLSGNQNICVGLTTTFASTVLGGTWTSSNNVVATINSATGFITGISAGNATMTYTVVGTGGCANVSDIRIVTVTTPPVAGTLSGNQNICVGLTTTFSSTVLGGTWTSSNNVEATINSATGFITGISAGNATMTYTVVGTGGCANVSDTRIVTVTAPPVPGTLSGNQNICVGLTTTFSSTVLGGTWSSSNIAVATINSATGFITGVSAGTATMTYTVLGTGGCANVSDTRIVTVTAPPIPGVLSGNQNICVGLTTTFSSTVLGGTWISSNLAVATINSATGFITGVSAGNATMTYTVLGTGGCANVSGTRIVTVTTPPIAGTLSGIQTVCQGNTRNFTPTVSGGTWTSSNPSVATVTPITGIVTGVSAGIATITYTILGTGGCPNVTVDRQITVTPTPQLTNTGITTICSNDTSNVLLTVSAAGASFTWTVSQSGVTGATSGSGNTINQTLSSINGGNAIYTVTPTLNGCIGNAAYVVINVKPLPKPTLNDGQICIELATDNASQPFVLNAGLNDSTHDFQWFINGATILDETSSTLAVSEAGEYSVIATNNVTGCISNEVYATITSSVIADAFTTSVTEAFEDNPYIIVNTPAGTGPFQYQLDSGAFQSSNVFYNLPSGLHTITVKDNQGCTDLSGTVFILNYPHFFTPNGDTYNDTWNIWELKDQPIDGIYIFDRYGKFIKQISPIGIGWDGTLNGYPLPATDYWFTVDYVDPNTKEQHTFKSHFSLKR
jgi:gliding motility-associated-like protein